MRFLCLLHLTSRNPNSCNITNKGAEEMIVYSPFWETLKTSEESTYTLITKHRISSSTIDKLRNNKPITTTTLNDLCRILECKVEDIALYIPSDHEQKL